MVTDLCYDERMSMHASLIPVPSDVRVHARVWRDRSTLGVCMETADIFKRRGRYDEYPSIADLINASGDCWEWLGSLNAKGYGVVGVNSRHLLAHRAVWECLVGPITDGLQIDHLCRNNRCVNPDHLEPVTGIVNRSRGIHANRQKTHCPQGHPYSGTNLVRIPTGGRLCRTCRNSRS